MFQRTKICSGLLLAFGSSLLTIAPGAFAQDTTVQRVEITGSSIKRVDAETSVPVTVITADALKKAGVTSVEQVLQQVSSVQVQLTSSQAVGAGTGGGSYADMRGLGANKTLVLLNGRRLANSAFTASAPDINTIPFAAIERVEVLRDGASALYGTDAIAGVINFITRKDYHGGTITLGLDSPQHPGGAQHEAQAGFGFGDLEKDGLNIFGFAGFQKQAEIGASQRHLAPHKLTSSTTFPATVFFGPLGVRPGKGTGYTPFAGPAGCTDPTLVVVSPLRCGEDTNQFVNYIPASERVSGLMNASFKVGQNHTFSLEAFVAQSKVNAKIAPVPYAPIFIDPTSPYYPSSAAGALTPLPAGTVLDPNQVDAAPASIFGRNGNGTANEGRMVARFRDLVNGYREDDNTTTQGRFVASMEGTLGEWDYNAAVTLNTTHTQDFLAHGYSDENVLGTLDNDPNSATLGYYVLNPAINPFGAQSAAGAAILKAASKQGVLQYGNGTVKVVDGHASRDIGDWLHAGRPAAIAVGAEYRSEKFLNQANTAFASQVVASTGVDPNTFNAGKRDVYAAYTELNVPVLKSLDVTAALRYDHYNDFGSTTNPKVSFRFQPAKAFLLRGSFSTGFRAPSLYELNAAQTFTNSTSGVSDPKNCSTDAQGHVTPLNGFGIDDVCSYAKGGDTANPNNSNQIQFVNKTGGNTALKAEKSKNFTLGLVLEPISNLTTEFDYYNIRITKEVGVLPDTFLYTAQGLAEFPGNFHYNGSGALTQNPQGCPSVGCGYVDTLNQNIGSVNTSGVDVAIGYKLNAGAVGRFNFELQSTWVHSYKYQLVPGGAFTENVGIFSAGNGEPVFRWQHNLSVDWTYNALSLGLSVHRKSGYVDFDPSHKVPAFTTEDLYATYAMDKGFSLTVGVKNLTDRLPPFSNYTGLFQQGYDPRYYDPTGRTFYARGTYSF
ncbi:MAG: TonB-dependent receptor [Pseudomonadota bacterium]|nr:TonB-dependent receptor [Pseudomonadota bacterium]